MRGGPIVGRIASAAKVKHLIGRIAVCLEILCKLFPCCIVNADLQVFEIWRIRLNPDIVRICIFVSASLFCRVLLIGYGGIAETGLIFSLHIYKLLLESFQLCKVRCIHGVTARLYRSAPHMAG